MPSLGETVSALTRLRKGAARSRRSGGPVRLSETLTFGPNPGGLRMLHYRPEDLTPGSPLVVVLHGCTQNAEDYASGAGWITLADRYGFALLCPEQRSGNNQNLCFNWFQPEHIARGKGEAASIRQMIAHFTDAHDLDPARVFITGLSAGGAMTNVMLAAYPEVFAGGAVIAGLPYRSADSVQAAFGAMFQPQTKAPAAWGDLVRDASPHTGPWPRVSVWHGDGDTTVKSANGEAIASQWADVHGATQAHADRVAGYRRLSWPGADGEPVVEHYMIDSMNHGTPLATGGADGHGEAGPFLLEVGISSSLEVLRFWKLAPAAATAATPIRQTAPAEAQAQPRLASPVTPSMPAIPPRPAHNPAHGIDVQAVITRALTAAGLMK